MNIPIEGVNLGKSSAPLTNITVDLDALTKEVDSVTVDGEETCKLMKELDIYPTLSQYQYMSFYPRVVPVRSPFDPRFEVDVEIRN